MGSLCHIGNWATDNVVLDAIRLDELMLLGAEMIVELLSQNKKNEKIDTHPQKRAVVK